MTIQPRSDLILALTSACLLVLSFPNFNQPWCAWVALVPWLLMLRNLSARQAFGWSCLVGWLFFLGSIWWLARLSQFAGPMAVVGWLILCAYLALYFGLFGLGVALLAEQRGRFYFLIAVSALWVALEYARSHLLSGFGWNLLAYSQTSWHALIQMADLTGSWGVSFLIVFVNATLATLVGQRMSKRRQAAMVAVVTIGLSAALGYGAWRMPQVMGSQTIRVSVVQGNIAQREKWDEAHRESILDRYEALTRQAAQEHPHLIVWPETSVPGFLGLDEPLTQRVIDLARSVGVAMLVGAPMGRLDRAVWRTTNSAALLDASGRIAQQHDKLHLVPLGEFVPFERTLPWLRNVLPPIGDFVPGDEYTVFHLDGSMPQAPSRKAEGKESLEPAAWSLQPFSVLICFEDIFPDLARQFVQEGAQLLLVITNDAWFGPTAAAYQHAQASTFRAIELRVPVARSANTGLSGCIDASGQWRGRVQDPSGTELFVAGTRTCDLPLGSVSSIYRRWGDWFAILCLLGALGLIGLRFRNAWSH